MQLAEDLSDAHLAHLVPRFYARVRSDALLGPVFNRAIDDWPAHLQKLTDFWSSVMLTTGRYKGQPMRAHMLHQAEITPEMFSRWLDLWESTAAQCLPPEAALAVVNKAHHIAASLQMGLYPSLPPRLDGLR